MKSQRSLTIGMRLTLGFAALVALMLVLAAFAMLRIGAISNAMQAQETVQQQGRPAFPERAIADGNAVETLEAVEVGHAGSLARPIPPSSVSLSAPPGANTPP